MAAQITAQIIILRGSILRNERWLRRVDCLLRTSLTGAVLWFNYKSLGNKLQGGPGLINVLVLYTGLSLVIFGGGMFWY